MGTNRKINLTLPKGEQPVVAGLSTGPVVADTFAGRIHVEWDNSATVTPFGQLPFFIEYLKQGGLFDGWVADCPLYFTSPNAPSKRDVLGTVLLSLLAGHRRYVHMTALRCDSVNPPLLCMARVVTEDAVRRLRQDTGRRRGEMAARASRLLYAAIVGGAVDSRCRHDGEAAVRPSGRRGGWI